MSDSEQLNQLKEKIKSKISELEMMLIKKNIFIRSFNNKGHKIITITEAEISRILLELKFLRECEKVCLH